MNRFEDNENEVERAKTPRLRITDIQTGEVTEIQDECFEDPEVPLKIYIAAPVAHL